MVPNGGEVVLDNKYNDIDNAAKDLASMHVSYLNNAHDLAVINKWKKQTYTDPMVILYTMACPHTIM